MEQKLAERARCYMKDCGCTPEQTEEYLRLAAGGCTQDQIYFMKRHRNQTMCQLHAVTRQVDRIDFVIHELEQELKKNG
ncbi:MAG: hypothetical protein HUJ67_02445 [Ruminiclostridium sp.]|nr:hypothetical protein [Ruminiclostridium sp.]MCF0187863.1 hypothetical protein [Bacteroidaceae bacterium]